MARTEHNDPTAESNFNKYDVSNRMSDETPSTPEEDAANDQGNKNLDLKAAARRGKGDFVPNASGGTDWYKRK